jgi:uncharacterized protein YrrD
MLVTIKALLGASVKSLQTGMEVAKTTVPLIDPRNLKLMALYVEGRSVDFSPAVLIPTDIREVGPLGIIIDDADKIIDPAEIVRLQEIIGFDFVLDGISVVDEKNHKLGRVEHYGFDPDSYFVQQLYVKPSLGRAFKLAQIIVNRQQIVDINNKRIVVKIPTEKLHQAAKTLQQMQPPAEPFFENPFRKPKPSEQPEN